MEPVAKQALLSDLQRFFDKDTKLFYRNNGTPYRRGYLLYGPLGTGQTSLSQAITSEYGLELFVVDLTEMSDTDLQDIFKRLPSRCVVLMEDIDAADFDQQYDDYDDNHDHEMSNKKTRVTLSGLLNTLDGFGAAEGRLIILTTNAPDALDKAVHRPGGIDRKIYLGYSTTMSAACTFPRIFGNDPKEKFPADAIAHLATKFGKKIPHDMSTPCEIQEFCMEHRGQPIEALKDFPKFVEERIAGKHEFEYDINRQQKAKAGILATDEEGSEPDEEVYASLGRSKHQKLSDMQRSEGTERYDTAYHRVPVDDFVGIRIDPELACGTYYPAQDRVQDRSMEKMKRGSWSLLGRAPHRSRIFMRTLETATASR
ncbi:P-loop containing nucleoside triphosphate hydrolase protein [Ophiobolus disseminans]|uniref:P-loop containing nucleoside triphosphate hydrolase protein n=1 Tax=Ophiobolus disseminans TaxID=1469910 RepID=A0A6A6ZPC1_9PLEO|nr:P-loop containing nucleoside triphosphate hydrolase protein [Ophiobolus disseminans]